MLRGAEGGGTNLYKGEEEQILKLLKCHNEAILKYECLRVILNGSHRTAGLVVAIYFKLAKLNSGALIHTQAHRDLYRDPKKVVRRGSWGFGLLRKPQASTRDIPEGAWSARALVALVAPAGELIRGCRPRGTQSLG